MSVLGIFVGSGAHLYAAQGDENRIAKAELQAHTQTKEGRIRRRQQALDAMGIPSTVEDLHYGPGIDDSILDPDQKEELVAIIDKLISDKAPLVVGSAAMAFNEVCGDRMNLIHKSYRKLCLLLADVDEWGQLALLNVLTYYAKTCFPDPNNEVYEVIANEMLLGTRTQLFTTFRDILK